MVTDSLVNRWPVRRNVGVTKNSSRNTGNGFEKYRTSTIGSGTLAGKPLVRRCEDFGIYHRPNWRSTRGGQMDEGLGFRVQGLVKNGAALASVRALSKMELTVISRLSGPQHSPCEFPRERGAMTNRLIGPVLVGQPLAHSPVSFSSSFSSLRRGGFPKS